MQRIKNSLTAKVFLWVLCALTVCSLAIYGIVMLVVPRRYTALSDSRTTREIETLTEVLKGTDYRTAYGKIEDFCRQNHVAAMLTTGNQQVTFGEPEDFSQSENSFTVTVNLRFSDRSSESFLTWIALASTAGELRTAFWNMLPWVAAVILLITTASAWLCSRVIVKPVLKISSVSKRMAQMDMTWHCDVKRSDELGVLADSLNTLSGRLTQALGELEAANARLREDIASANALEKQRRDFFAAASHELKTPVTILKAQIESMLLKIGKYQDVEARLPETLREVENMERLVREILAVSKMELQGFAENPEPVPVRELLQRTLTDLIPLAREKSITIRQTMEDAWLMGSERLFQKALHNILSNAVRHSPPGAQVSVRLTPALLTVENTGVTLPAAEIPALFTPFYRVEKSRSRSTGGTGLGLYLVRTILELHGLPYALANGDGGVVFTVWLQPENEIKIKSNES